MKQLLLVIFFLLHLSACFTQQIESACCSIKDLSFMEGRWKAIAKDSSFSSVLEYKFSPEKKMLYSSNHLYGKSGNLFRFYEGAYFIEGNSIQYFLSGPKGEVHKGKAILANHTLTHLAHIYPGTGIKSYKSELSLIDGRLYYYANYSKKDTVPSQVDHTSPLIYEKLGQPSSIKK